MNTYEIEVLIGQTYTTEVVAESLAEAYAIADDFDPDNTNNHHWEIGEVDRHVTVVGDEPAVVDSADLTKEQRLRWLVMNTALRIASDLESLEKLLDTPFYTDDDNDLNAHYVHDGDWFNHTEYAFRFMNIGELQKKIERWGRKLQSAINDDLLTDPTNNQ